jgi:hypothetical protein
MMRDQPSYLDLIKNPTLRTPLRRVTDEDEKARRAANPIPAKASTGGTLTATDIVRNFVARRDAMAPSDSESSSESSSEEF